MNWLLADIGGTNSRCALWNAQSGLRLTRRYENRKFRGLVPLLTDFVRRAGEGNRPVRAWLAVAAPVWPHEPISMINISWSFSREELIAELELNSCEIINDFGALAYCIPELLDQDFHQVGGGQAQAEQVCGVLGPGTGLGVALLVPTAAGWTAVTGEGGHVSLAGQNEQEEAIIRECRKRYGHCSAERLISGSGLSLIHELLHGTEAVSPAEIGQRAADGDKPAEESLKQMFLFLATVASDLAVTAGARGGVYISGGIVPRYLDLFAESGFRDRFEDKGRYRDYLGHMATRVITAEDPGLRGLAALARSPA